MTKPVGRPRTTSLPPNEMIALGEEMLTWVKINKPLHLNEWYSIEKSFLYEEWKCFIRMEEFRPYYERALNLVGRQYLDKESRIRDGISQRWQRIYFRDLREQEDEDADADAQRKQKIQAAGINETDIRSWVVEQTKNSAAGKGNSIPTEPSRSEVAIK